MDRRFLRPGWMVGHLLVLAAVLTCLRLGVWQWDRTQEATGTAQNFGYAVLWPAFGIAFVYMWIKFLKLEQIKDQEDDAELTALAAGPDGPDAAPDGGVPDADPVPDPGTTAAPRSDEPPVPDPSADDPAPAPSRRRRTSAAPVTLSAVEVPSDYDDDPELTAYNQALAALAEEDRRRG